MSHVAVRLACFLVFPSLAASLPASPPVQPQTRSTARQDKLSAQAKPSGSPRTAKEYFQRGLRSFQRRAFAEALPDVDRAIELVPDIAPLYYLRGVILINLGKYDQALPDLDHAIQRQANYADAYAARGCVYYAQKKFDRTVVDCTRAIQLDAKQAEAFRFRGMAYRRQGKGGKALSDLSEAIRLDPDSVEARIVRARLRVQASQWDGVLEDCNAALRTRPGNVNCLLLRVSAYSATGDDRSLLADAAEVIRLIQPKDAEDYRRRGEMHHLRATVREQYFLRHPQETVKEMRRTLQEIEEIHPEAAPLPVTSNNDDATNKDPFAPPPPFLSYRAIPPVSATSQPALSAPFRSDPCNPPPPLPPLPPPSPSFSSARQRLTTVGSDSTAENSAERQQALADYNEALRLDPRNVDTYRDRAQLYLDLEDFAHSLADHAATIRLCPKDARAYAERGDSYVERWNPFHLLNRVHSLPQCARNEDYRRAIADYTTALRLSPTDAASLYRRRGHLYLDLDDNDRAIADCTEALRLQPNEERAYRIRAIAYRQKKDYRRAIADCTALIARAPSENLRWYEERAQSYEALGDSKHALADYTTMIRLRPQQASSYRERGDFLRRTGKGDRALSDYAEALRLLKSEGYSESISAELHGQRGGIFLRQGKLDVALAEYSQAIEQNDAEGDNYAWRTLIRLCRGERALADDDGERAVVRYRACGRRLPRTMVFLLLGDYRQALADYCSATPPRDGRTRCRGGSSLPPRATPPWLQKSDLKNPSR